MNHIILKFESQNWRSTKLNYIPIKIEMEGLEPSTFKLIARRSFQLSYISIEESRREVGILPILVLLLLIHGLRFHPHTMNLYWHYVFSSYPCIPIKDATYIVHHNRSFVYRRCNAPLLQDYSAFAIHSTLPCRKTLRVSCKLGQNL